MAYIEMKLDKLASSLRVMKNASAILYIITPNLQNRTIRESIKVIEPMVRELDDKRILDLYDKIYSVFHSGVPHQQINPDDYFAFVERLGILLEEATSQADIAMLAVQKSITSESIIGKWNGRAVHS